jgi:beta-glucosidase
MTRRDFLAASIASAAALSFGRCLSAEALPYDSSGIDPSALMLARKRAAKLVSSMTLEEVFQQMGNLSPALPRLGLSRYDYWSEALHGVNAKGPITSFPQPISLGCSWNPSLVHQVYTAISDEARAFHNKTGHGLTFFSPATVNMGLRDPRWGRANENFSEDPFLVQIMGVTAIQGMQGDDPRYLKTVACAKHYICNDTDDDRDYADATPDRRSFWEYYTRGFEASITKAKVFSVMAAYSSLWGVPCPANHMLLTDILRERWGFDGYVVSDCDAIADIYQTHHYVETAPEAVALAIKAGSDLNCGSTFSEYLMSACEQKHISEQAIRTALTRVLTARFLLGEFDPPSQVPWSGLSAASLEDKQHRELAREAARQSIVLLKNEGQLLPLRKQNLRKLAVIGPMASACHLGDYSGVSSYLVSPDMGIAVALNVPFYSDVVEAGNYLRTSDYRGPVAAFSNNGEQYLSKIKTNDWAQYGPLNFTGKTSIEFHLASIADGEISLYLNSLGKAPVLTLRVPATGGIDLWEKVSAPLPGLSGEHVVFLHFSSAIRKPFLDLQSFRMLPVTAPAEPACQITFAPGCSIDGPKIDALFNSALSAAQQADAVILLVGDNSLISHEGHDRTFLHLPGAQHDLIRAVVEVNRHAVIVVNSCCPVALNWEKDNAPAILCSYFAGEQQGNAIADVIFGDYNPGGKLCSTWYRDVDQLPNFHDYDIKNGSTYMYFQGDPLYPFGHGLSYTSFSYGDLQLSGNRLLSGHAITLTLEVANTGQCAGDEIIQFYVHAGGGNLPRPIKQLAGFCRISLQPDEKRKVTFSLPHDHIVLRYWDESKGEFAYDGGRVDLMVGSSSSDIRLRSNILLL